MNAFAILADTAVKGSLVLAMAAAEAWTLRKRSAAARHLVWTAAAAALLALPLLSLTLPVMRVPVLRASAQSPGAMVLFRVFSNGRAGESTSQSAGTAAALRQSTPTRGNMN